MTAAWILRRVRRQTAAQRRAMGAAAGAFLVLVLVSGTALLGVRATRGWMKTVGQRVNVIAFLRDEMGPEQSSQLVGVLQRMPGVAQVREVAPADALARLRDAARPLPGSGSWLKDLEPGYFPRSIEVELAPTGDLPQRAAELSRRLRGLEGVADVDAMLEGVGRLHAWIRFGQRLGWAVVAVLGILAVWLLTSAVFRARESHRRQAQVLVVLGETAHHIRMPGHIALAAAGLTGSMVGVLVLRLAWPALLGAVERALGLGLTPGGFFLSLGESAAYLLATPLLGWGLGYLSTPVPNWVDA
ncbi:MAG TPA: permease-like cell division protein FtsX [Polyangia bacterium]